MAKEQRVREEPRISINKLGEYLGASPRRRRTIIEQQKRPPTFIVTYYQDAQDAITRYIADATNDDKIILEAIAQLEGSTPSTEWDEQRINLCVEALESFLDHASVLSNISCLTPHPGDDEAAKLVVKGVDVSIRPNIILRGTDRKENPVVGALKLAFGKTQSLDDTTGRYIATAIHQWVETFMTANDEAVSLKCSCVFDVFSGRLFSAPRSFTRRRQDIEAACDEIKHVWPHA